MRALSDRPNASREDGFTLVEVLVAAFILVLGALGVFMTLAAGINNVQRSKSTQVAVDVAQREMERLRSYPFEQLAHTPEAVEAFEPEADPESPDSRISGSGSSTEFDLSRGAPTDDVPLAVSIEGQVQIGPEEIPPIEGSTMQVFRYITQDIDEECTTAKQEKADLEAEEAETESEEVEPCTFKRAVVAVWLEAPSNRTYRPRYYELQSDFTDPAPGSEP